MFLSKTIKLKKGNNKIRLKIRKKKDSTKGEKLSFMKKIKWELEYTKRLIKWRMTSKTSK